jgi:CBS domain-containing protein
MKVSEVMHKGAETVDPDASLASIAKLMRDRDIGAVPVVKNGKLMGIVTDRDVTIRALADGRDVDALKARDVMTSEVTSCRESDDAERAIETMEAEQIRRLPVLDGSGRLVGMVSLGDISHRMSRDVSAEILKSVSAHHA